MRTDILGQRGRIGIILPPINTPVETEMADIRPEGVSNHAGRMGIPNMPLTTNAEFQALIEALDMSLSETIDSVGLSRAVGGLHFATFSHNLMKICAEPANIHYSLTAHKIDETPSFYYGMPLDGTSRRTTADRVFLAHPDPHRNRLPER